MSTFIEARVIQKVDTEANWLSNPLKLYQGEIAFVSDKYNFKLNNTDIPKTFAELEYYYKGDILGGVLPTDDLESEPDGVYRATISGTYNGVVVKEGYYTLLRKKDDGSWVLESEVKMPIQDLTKIETELESTKTKVDDFIRDFAVTTDTEFNANSNNPIANSAVTPLAESLSGFTNGKTTVFSMNGAEVGLRDDLKNFYSVASYRSKIFDLPTGNKYLNFRGFKPNVLQSKLNNYSCIFVELNTGVIQKIVPPTTNSDNGDLVELKKVKLPDNAVKMYVNVMWFGTSVNYTTLIEILDGKTSNVKYYIDKKTSALDELKRTDKYEMKYSVYGLYDKNGNIVVGTTDGRWRSTIIPITSNAISFRFYGYQATIGNGWLSGIEDFICVAFKMNDNTFKIVLHPKLEPSEIIDRTFDIPEGAKEIYLSWRNLQLPNGDWAPSTYFVYESQSLEEYILSVEKKVPKSYKYDLSWRNFLGVNKVNVSESFVTGTQQERLQQALDFAEGKSITLILGKDHLSGSMTWNIESSLLIGDDTALVIEEGVKIKFSKNYVVDTIIRNKGIGTIQGAELHSTDYMTGTGRVTPNKNIIILGAGEDKSFIEGSDIPYTANRPGTSTPKAWATDEYGWRTLSILMCNVDGLEIGGFHINKGKCWLVPIFHATNFWIHDLHVESHGTNGDGVDIIACKGGIVENILADLYDDAVFVGYVSRRNIVYPHYQYIYPCIPNILDVKDKPISFQDTSNIDVRNITGNSRSVLCRIMVIDGPKVSNISVNGLNSYNLGRGGLCTFTVEGNYESNITPPAKVGDIMNISANNIVASNPSFGFGEVCRVEGMARNVWVNDVTNKTSSRTINTGLDASVKVTNLK